MYQRNFLYIDPPQQEKIAQTRILLGGVGLGSVIAEAALRTGFNHLILIDGDTVELSNLNRQNYTDADIGMPKVEALKKRLLQIKPDAQIECHQVYLDEINMQQYIAHCDIAINAIDFASEAPFLFDSICRQQGIPVLHPYNFGWAGCVYVVSPESRQLRELSPEYRNFELAIADYTLYYLEKHSRVELDWLYELIRRYEQHKTMSPPQLAVGSWLVGGMVANVLFCLVNNIPVKTFPEPYFLSSRSYAL